MTFAPDNLHHPRTWLRDVVQFTLDEFAGDPLNMPRAAAAMTIVYQYHAQLFYCLTRAGKGPAESLEGFRAHLGRTAPSFNIIASAADIQTRERLAFTDIVLGRPALDLPGAGAQVQRAIIVAGSKRQLMPLLEDTVAGYRRILDAHGL
ncbi:MAG: hypothetical protein K2P94_00595 [Rhodospirillaceae bacterium]|nr:hypothetical protein [Rhodospirillaceae bacterium]